MSMTTYGKEIPRLATMAYLRLARLPLSAVERVAGQRGNEQWGPALAFEGFEASIESVVGSVLHDESLQDSAKLRRAKLQQLRQAANLETVAEQKRQQADETFQTRREAAEEKRKQAAKRAEKREADLERQAAEKERTAKQRAAKKAATADSTKARQEKVISRQERAAKLSALDAEAEALATAKEAVDTKETVEVIDETIEGQQEARKTS